MKRNDVERGVARVFVDGCVAVHVHVYVYVYVPVYVDVDVNVNVNVNGILRAAWCSCTPEVGANSSMRANICGAYLRVQEETPAMSNPSRARVASARSMTAIRRPSYITPIRSDKANSSSRSSEISRVAIPRSRCSSRR